MLISLTNSIANQFKPRQSFLSLTKPHGDNTALSAITLLMSGYIAYHTNCNFNN